MGRFLLFVACALVFNVVTALYVPGVPLQNYEKDFEITLDANSIRSMKTQLPYEYYTLPVCTPTDIHQQISIIYQTLNLGEVLQGDRIVSTPIKIKVLDPTPSTNLCAPVTLATDTRATLVARILEEYKIHFILDNMPITVFANSSDSDMPGEPDSYSEGFLVGSAELNEVGAPPTIYVRTHYRFKVLYHSDDVDAPTKATIVGFQIHEEPSDFVLVDSSTTQLQYSYEVNWERSPLPWRNRWDPILTLPATVTDAHVKTFVISLILVALLVLMVLFTLFRTVRDIRRYNAAAAEREASDIAGSAEFDETGWKNCHDDVFRRPTFSGVLAVLVGAGCHMAAVAFLTMVLAAFGILSPASRGSWLTAFAFIYAFTGVLAGFISVRLFRMFREATPLKIAFASSMLWTSLFAFLGLLLGFVMIPTGSTMAPPFGTYCALIGLWIVFIVGNFAGRLLARRGRTYQYPVKVNDLPREIAPAPWYVRPVITSIIAGILPFAVMFIALHYVEESMWIDDRPYYLYGFSILTVILTLFTAASTSIIVTYFFLCWEDYHWWWRSFFTSASSALYVFVYLIYFLAHYAHPTTGAGTFLFLVHAIMVSVTIGLFLGAVGMLTTLLYVWRMYASVKID